MKAKLLKVVFPFYSSERHGFLMEKWWFRLALVFYILGLVALPFLFMASMYESYAGWCYDTLYLYYDDGQAFNEQLDKCGEYAKEAQPYIWLSGIVGPLVVHYLLQFIFFKIIVNFIVLGGKSKIQN